MKLHLCVLAFGFLSSVALAQDADEPKKLELPECDIFLFDISESKESITISNARNVTKRPGYDNQPWFTPDGKSFLFTANHAADRTDVFEYFIESGETKQVTDSASQEYSPQISPDNQRLSFVTDGEDANQSISWMERKSGADAKPKWLLKHMGDREPVGYYSWNHETGYILFWSRYGYCMKLVHESKKESHYITGNAVPSSPYIIPGTKRFSFVHQQGNGEVWIKELDPETRAVRPLTRVVGSSNRNYGWTPDRSIVMCESGKLHRWNESVEGGWKEVADLAELGITGATRVAVSPDGKHLAVVGLPAEK